MGDSDASDLVEGLDAAVWEADVSTWSFTRVHGDTLRLSGYPANEWTHIPGFWLSRIHPDSRERVAEEARAVVATGQGYRGEYRVHTANGEERWVHETVHPAGPPDDPRLRGVTVDVTERRQEQTNLEHAWRDLQAHVSRLESVNDAKDSFLTTVSHEMRTPLATVLGIALTLERAVSQLKPEEAAELLGRLAANARKLDTLLNDLLDLDRAKRGVLTPARVTTQLHGLVQRVVTESDVTRDHPVEVRTDAITVEVDQSQIERIVDNLLINAARHTPAGTPVWVRAENTDEGALLIVEDAGPGVPAELRDTIFEPFQQGRGPEGTRRKGVGVGLSLVARFAELHGGRAWVDERPGGGASFRVLLPQAAAPDRRPRRTPVGPAA